MPVYDYKCPNGHITERRESIETAFIRCPVCDQIAPRQAIYKDQYPFGDNIPQYQMKR